MKIIVHDWCGHHFTSQLARALASSPNEVLYLSFSGFQSPKGRNTNGKAEPMGFQARELNIADHFDKDNLIRRRRQQIQYGKIIADVIKKERPDIVLSANTPIEVQTAIQSAVYAVAGKSVFWVQDINAEAVERILAKKNKILGRLAGFYYRRKESQLIKKSDAVVVIAEEFREVFAGKRWGLDVSQMHVIENWANIEDIPLLDRDNPWSQKNMRTANPRIVYSGTLARKHNPDLLLELARNLEADIYLFSEGSSADYVKRQAEKEGLENMFVQPWVSVEDLPSMLSAADILFAVIEPDAGVFSVPSKVLSYFCAGKPILASIPLENLAAQNVLRERAGFVADPSDKATLIALAGQLLADAGLRAEMGRNGRSYAEKAFDIGIISGKFSEIFSNLDPKTGW